MDQYPGPCPFGLVPQQCKFQLIVVLYEFHKQEDYHPGYIVKTDFKESRHIS